MDRLLSMRVFLKVVDEGGFAAAARALDLSPAVVTRLVADLEQHLQARLMQRTTRKLALTDAGEAYLQRVRGILSDIEDAEALTLAHTREVAGVLRVLVPPVLAVYHVAPLLPAFRRRHPKLTVDLQVESPAELPIEQFDLTLVVSDGRFDANVVARPIVATPAVLCAAPAYLQTHGTPQTPDDLARHDCLKMRSSGSPRRWHLSPAGEAGSAATGIDVPINPVIVANHTDTLLRATLAGAGIGSQPLALAGAYLETGELVRVLPEWTSGYFTLYAALPTRKHLPARTRAFVDFLVEQAAERRARAEDAYPPTRPRGAVLGG